MKATFTKGPDYLIAHIASDLDHHQASFLKEEIDKELNRTKARRLIMDLSQVKFMDSSGIGLILGRYKHLSAMGGEVIVSGLQGEMERIYQISGLQKIIKTCVSVENAVRGV